MAKTTAVAKAKINLPANVHAALASEVATIQSRIGAPSGNRIKVTQSKRFRMPSGEENPGPIQAIIIDFVSMNALYDGPFDPNDIAPPICAAIGNDVATLSPVPGAPDVQCDSCAACPQNQFGSKGRGKACQNTRILALLAPDTDPKAESEAPIMLLKVSPTGLRSFDGYVASVARALQVPPIGVVTEISFDPGSDFPSLRFGNPLPATQEQVAMALSRREEARQILNTPPDFAAAEAAKAAVPAKKPVSRRGR